MPFNFPASPAPGAVFNDPTTGAQYTFQNGVWMQATPAQFRLSAQTRNRLVNPAMQVCQQNAGVGTNTSGGYGADQWVLGIAGATGIGLLQVTQTPPDPPFALNLGNSVARPSLSAGDYAGTYQPIEGFRVADFAWGSAGARQAILDFKVKASVAGTFCVSIVNLAGTRSWLGSYTIAAGEVGTWVRRTLIIPGDVAAGVWAVDGTTAMSVMFHFAAGSTWLGVPGWQAGDKRTIAGATNGIATTSSFYISEVGLYLDPSNVGVPPPFQIPDTAQTFLDCRRYWGGYFSSGQTPVAGYLITPIYFMVPMRIVPSVTNLGAGSINLASAIIINGVNQFGAYLQFTSSGAAGYVLNRIDAFNARM